MNIISRRKYLTQQFKAGLGALLATTANVPFGVQRALAEGNIGLNGKKLLFIFLRGGNDGLNTLIPVLDPAYASNRPNTRIPMDTGTDYTTVTGTMDFTPAGSTAGTYDSYPYAIRAGNGFAAVHPSLKWLAPLYNAGHLAFIHRVGYVSQSRSNSSSMRYWETGVPNDNTVQEGHFYRTMMQSGLAGTRAFLGLSFQSSLPLSLNGYATPAINVPDITRFNLLGIPNTTAGNLKFDPALKSENPAQFPAKNYREALKNNYKFALDSLGTFEGLVADYNENPYRDDVVTDGDEDWATAWDGQRVDSKGRTHGPGYYLFPKAGSNFPSADTINGGYARDPGQSVTQLDKYVITTSSATSQSSNTSLFNNLLASALVLNQTDAFIVGTEYSGFETHDSAVIAGSPTTGNHANLMRRLSWAFYSLWKYFSIYGKGGTNELPGAKTSWNDLVIVTMSEIGRTTVENTTLGFDDAEASVMLVAGGAVKGYGKPTNTNGSNGGIFACNTTGCDGPAYNNKTVNWVTGNSGSMFAAGGNRYLGRAVDYRSVLGRIIRKHLGATQNQLNTILPGYATESTQRLLTGGVCTDGITIAGEPDFI
ncbi:MAG: DUF1501 domain-containing protein [Verrucomicrobia bacterium]|nr:DUF1501 domain-containing protein [Verrucomicrobiota bacterium]